MYIFSVQNNISSLLLVDNKRNVINGSYRLKRDKEGYYIPLNGIRVQLLGRAPRIIRDRINGSIDYNETLRIAGARFHMPLFDGPIN